MESSERADERAGVGAEVTTERPKKAVPPLTVEKQNQDKQQKQHATKCEISNIDGIENTHSQEQT